MLPTAFRLEAHPYVRRREIRRQRQPVFPAQPIIPQMNSPRVHRRSRRLVSLTLHSPVQNRGRLYIHRPHIVPVRQRPVPFQHGTQQFALPQPYHIGPLQASVSVFIPDPQCDPHAVISHLSNTIGGHNVVTHRPFYENVGRQGQRQSSGSTYAGGRHARRSGCSRGSTFLLVILDVHEAVLFLLFRLSAECIEIALTHNVTWRGCQRRAAMVASA